jgi:hypothetical protein
MFSVNPFWVIIHGLRTTDLEELRIKDIRNCIFKKRIGRDRKRQYS